MKFRNFFNVITMVNTNNLDVLEVLKIVLSLCQRELVVLFVVTRNVNKLA